MKYKRIQNFVLISISPFLDGAGLSFFFIFLFQTQTIDYSIYLILYIYILLLHTAVIYLQISEVSKQSSFLLLFFLCFSHSIQLLLILNLNTFYTGSLCYPFNHRAGRLFYCQILNTEMRKFLFKGNSPFQNLLVKFRT